MTERGMIFNSEMVRAILDGRKTQTRRIMKVQPESNQLGLLLITDSTKHSDIGKYHWAESNATGNHVRSKLFSCPFGAVGDRIWVRETWARYNIDQNSHDIAYRATTPEDWPEEGRWRPSIHMPRWASRILLEITDVRVERLNAISQENAQAEGMELTGWRPTYSDPDSGGEVMTPYDNFAELWSSIYGDESWKANPWVWVIEFKRVEGGAA
ncbi:morphogenetic protein [Klebsiella pneumoniae]|uniref:morphogenetic protein n=1 Tax=Klebsiella pneumoniae TaxID=573 RepID=UPI002072F1EA|nr:morphogenetic protein [Klebsiella pneumoniae]MCM6105536.1 morphogenetic protein [Klebsiella pneumoniae]MCW6224898.1 morphogenetic protein [Klebsiella pneumoniae]MCW6252468.1 morphogenetic protein [Klebsiella pneumoniae]MCW6257590.1 morphogenetic protein [Klebsiella pneumoniae]MCW6263225.1 morphogenetic protein [Klebsiella pneumoniae]